MAEIPGLFQHGAAEAMYGRGAVLSDDGVYRSTCAPTQRANLTEDADDCSLQALRRRRLQSADPAERLRALRSLLLEEPDLYPVLAPRIREALATRGRAVTAGTADDLRVVPVSIAEARAFVERHHKHHHAPPARPSRWASPARSAWSTWRWWAAPCRRNSTPCRPSQN